MRAVAQRVREARVEVGGEVVGAIGAGLLVLLGVALDDRDEDAEWLARKLAGLRIFGDEEGVMNRSVVDAGGALLAVSQFTLHASTRKGNRPSWSAAAPPERARPAFDDFVARLAAAANRPVATGRFGADMRVSLVNDGPVTIVLDSRLRE